MKQRLASPKAIVDLSRVAELKGIDKKGNALVIGAMTTHAEVANSAVVRVGHRRACPTWPASSATRTCATAAPSAARSPTTIPPPTIPPPCWRSAPRIGTNKREIKADDFFKGLFTTALQDGEIITRISFPIPAKFGYAKFANPASRYALVGVAVAQTGSGGARRGDGRRQRTACSAMRRWKRRSAKGWSAQALTGHRHRCRPR